MFCDSGDTYMLVFDSSFKYSDRGNEKNVIVLPGHTRDKESRDGRSE